MPLGKRDEPAFRIFIEKLLTRASLEEECVRMFLSEENMPKWRRAFTHSTASATENFELYEHQGDTIVNLVCSLYIKERYPDISSVAWLTKLKHNFQSGKFLNEIAQRHGFFEFLVYGDRFKEWINNSPFPDYLVPAFKAAKEDTVEAFFGCLSDICSKTFPGKTLGKADAYGLALDISIRVLFPLLDETIKELKYDAYDYEAVFDASTRLKEAVDKRTPIPGSKIAPRWTFSGKYGVIHMTEYDFKEQNNKDTGILFYHAVAKGFHVHNPENARNSDSYVIAESYGFERSQTQDDVCRKALLIIKNDPSYEKKFGIKDVPKLITAPNQNKIRSLTYTKSNDKDRKVLVNDQRLVEVVLKSFKGMTENELETRTDNILGDVAKEAPEGTRK
jgi:hypothetical protein